MKPLDLLLIEAQNIGLITDFNQTSEGIQFTVQDKPIVNYDKKLSDLQSYIEVNYQEYEVRTDREVTITGIRGTRFTLTKRYGAFGKDIRLLANEINSLINDINSKPSRGNMILVSQEMYEILTKGDFVK